MRRHTLLLTVGVIFSSSAAAQDQLPLIGAVSATYKALDKTSYDFDMTEVNDFPGSMRNVTEQHWRIAGSGGKYRSEGGPSGILYVFDGQFQWAYNPNRHEYTKASARTSARHDPQLSRFVLAGYGARSARLLREETLDLATGSVTCKVVEVEADRNGNGVSYSPTTYWIDEPRNLVLKMTYKFSVQHAGQPSASEGNVTVSFTRADVGPLVDQNLFRFLPPDDAVQVEKLEFGPRSPLVDKEVPDFELKASDGTLITGKSLRGKLVLLQFSPRLDDSTLVFAEMAHRSFGGKGLTTLYILPLRVRSDAGELSHSVPIAFDSGALARAFGIDSRSVNSAGTVLIARDGKVLLVDLSYGDWGKLARILQKEAVW